MSSFTASTMSIDEATILRTSGFKVSVVKKPCSVRAIFEYEDSPDTRETLSRYMAGDCFNTPSRLLLITRADLYREARSARGGL